MAATGGMLDDFDLSPFIYAERIDDLGGLPITNDSAIMRVPVPTPRHYTTNADRQFSSAPSSNDGGSQVFTPGTDVNLQDEPGAWGLSLEPHFHSFLTPWADAVQPLEAFSDTYDHDMVDSYLDTTQYDAGFEVAESDRPQMQPYQPVPQLMHHRSIPNPTARRPLRQPGQIILPRSGPASTTAVYSTSKRGIRSNKLSEEQRQLTAQMRRLGACWRCVLQRDPCVGCQNGQCDRCAKALAGRPNSLPCDRTKLPMLIGDFLPASMQHVHEKQSILDDVGKEVRSWQTRLSHIALSPGFGPDFPWPVYEFVPTAPQYLIQFQYFTNSDTHQMERREKYSPPFGVKSIGQEDRSFSRYLDILLDPTQPHLVDYARQAYASETEEVLFPEEVLMLLVQFYTDTRDHTMQDLLKKVLRLSILTFIMGHTLTIPKDELPGTLHQLQCTAVPPGKEHQQHTSPRLANRQLKFYFSILRNHVYVELLKHGQKKLRENKKEQTWLHVFIIILGLAMVSEEIQAVLHLQALGNIAKRQMTEQNAHNQARSACGRIDDGFRLLVQLFQHKYRSDQWSCGSFGNQTPTFQDPVAVTFLQRLRMLVDNNLPFLEQARLSEPVRDNHCEFMSRLLARFLVPFTGLPEGGG